MERILLTGAQGQVGRAIQQLLKSNPNYELYSTSRRGNENGKELSLDIADENAVNTMVKEIKPDIILNCAAMTAVDLCETEREMAYQVNALGAKHLAIAAEETDATLLHISTDYVFDGEKKEPYIEGDQTNPISVYGKTKLAGELYVQEICKKSYIVRTAWVYGDGKNFVKTMLRLGQTMEGKPIRVVQDQVGSPTSALELALVILYLIETKCYGIYHATGEGRTSWYEFANAIFEEAGLLVRAEPITTAEYPTPAKRPKNSLLENRELKVRHGYVMKHWKEALHEYMVRL